MRNCELAIRRQLRIALGLGALHVDGAAHGIDHAVELDEQPVAHGLDQATVMRGDLRLEDFVQIGLKTSARPFLIGLAQAAIASDIGNQHGGEPALHASIRLAKVRLIPDHDYDGCFE